MTRNLKIQPSLKQTTDAANVQALVLNFPYSTHIFSGIGENFPNLQSLSIFNQPIIFVDRENFYNMTQLVRLGLFENKIEFLPHDVFDDLMDLEQLFLFDNRIKNFPRKIFDNLRKIKVINFDGNKIENLSKDLFINNVKLERIYAQRNPLRTIDVDFTKLSNLDYLNLQNAKCVNFWARIKSEVQKVQEIVNQNCVSAWRNRNLK